MPTCWKAKNLPVIFSTYHLSLLMGVNYHELKAMIADSTPFYKNFKLTKKSGGKRFITAPSELLKIVQNWILVNLLEKINSHPNVFSFQKHTSIGQNAAMHVAQPVILNLDLYRFFDSVSAKRVYGFFQHLGYAKNVAWDLSLLTTTKLPSEYWNEIKAEGTFSKQYLRQHPPVLPQGAPTSPLLSNFIAERMDKIFASVANNSGIKYSRYADDITFSGILANLPSVGFISKIITQEGFILHPTKTKYLTPEKRQSVTGLTVNDILRVNRRWKEDLRTQLYHSAKHGVESHQNFMISKTGIETKDNFKDYLYGKIRFLHSIEPEKAKKYKAIFDDIQWPL